MVTQQTPHPPVGIALLGKSNVWQTLGASSWVVSVLSDGYSLKFRAGKPILSKVPIFFNPPSLPAKKLALEEELKNLRMKRAIEPAPPNSKGFYSRIFLIPKKDMTWRPIIDLSSLNQYLEIPAFRMETPESIRLATQKNDWATSIDLKDAYLHIPIHPGTRKFLRFAYQNKIWQFKNLPFGLSPAPWLFTRLMDQDKIMANKKGLILNQYLDDWLIRSQDKNLLISQTNWLLNLCMTLGLQVNYAKSELVPTQTYNFVGYRYVNQEHKVYPTDSRRQLIKEKIRSFLSKRSQTAKTWTRLLGLLSVTEKLVPQGRLNLREIQYALKSQWSQQTGNHNKRVLITPQTKIALEWWSNDTNLNKGAPTHKPRPTFQIFTDASTEGWGSHLGMETASGRWSKTQACLHINNLEMKAVFLALKHWEQTLKNRTVLIATDNVTVACYINKQGGSISRSLTQEVTQILTWCHIRNIQVQARHVARKMNVLADKLSRQGQIIPSEWSLAPVIFKRICQQMFTPMIDLFAMRWNNKLPLYISPIPDEKAWAVDSISMSWKGISGYAYPPREMIQQVLNKVVADQNNIILIAPALLQTPWFNPMIQLLIQEPIELPPVRTLLSQPGNQVFHTAPGSLKLHAWNLSGNPVEQKAFLKRLPKESLSLSEPQLQKYMKQNGEFSILGVNQV